MKIHLVISLVLVYMLALNNYAQTQKLYDSIVLHQPDATKNKFKIEPAFLNGLQISNHKPKRTKGHATQVIKDIGWISLSVFLGELLDTDVTTGGDDDVEWLLKGKLSNDEPTLNWEYQFFTGGIHSKSYTYNLGSFNSDNRKQINWDDTAMGIALEGQDTISIFALFRYPDLNKIVGEISENNFEETKITLIKDLLKTFGEEDLFNVKISYALIGLFRDQKFAILNSENSGNYYIIKNGIVEAVLKLNFKPPFYGQKKPEERYLLLAKRNENRPQDYIRLGMLYYFLRDHDL
ncbi:MAG: hypothetical protein WBN28_05825 [Lutimonas sp.]|jgi:hypothetical protein